MKRHDDVTRDLFEMPVAPSPMVGNLDFRAEVAHRLAHMLADSGFDRYEIAARASRAAGKDVSKYMLDAYTAESREEFNLPLWLLPAIETACSSHALTAWLAEMRGARLFVGSDALAAELGRIDRQRNALSDRARLIKQALKETP